MTANIGDWASNFLLFFIPSKSKSQQIGKIEILPGDVTVSQGEEVDFSAVAYTAEGDTVGGLKFDWTVEFPDRVVRLQPMRNGRFKSKITGNYIVTAETAGMSAQVKVTVKADEALMLMKKLKDEKAKGDLTNINKLKNEGKLKEEEISSKKDYKPKDKDSDFLENVFGWLTGEEKVRGPNANDSEYNSVAPAALMRPADEDGWNNNNWWLADDPNNQTGNPPGTSPDAGAGNGNFQFSAPVVALPGRGIDVNLSLNYNSRLWSKSGTQMTYDADKGFPAPGWSLGFGKLMFMGSAGGCMMVDADGTRHGYTGSVYNYNYGGYSTTSFFGYTADGTFIDYDCYYSSNSYGKSLSGTAKLSNGTVITYNSPTITADQAFPTRITDAQGNYITITYRNNHGPEIQTVTDTMGRVITFNYDADNRLISVDVPKYDNGGTRTAIRLHYKQITLSPGFAAGYTTDTATNVPYVIDAIYYPGTNTGYWFNDSDSYSSYGMIAKVIEQRGMSWSGTAGTQGTVTQGTMSKQAVYDYPLTANYTLTDAPTYSNLTESWAGMDTAAAVTNYEVYFNAAPRTITVTQPNGLKSKQYLYNYSSLADTHPDKYKDGLIYQDETLDASNNILSKSVVTWQQGAYSSPRPTQTEVTDEKNQMLKTVNSYGTNYNQLTSVKEYDYDGTTLIRETKNIYENGASWTSRHIFNLVKTTEVYDGANNRVTRTDYEYDNAPLADTPNVIMYDRANDPNTPEWCENCGPCLLWEYGECLLYDSAYVSNGDAIYKGNVTKVTSYSDAQNLSGAVTENRKYDITGNLISTSSACCELTTFTYDSTYKYAYPVSNTRGSSDPNSTVKNTTSAVYDFNTGLVKQTTDANGLISTTAYNADTLRPTTSTSSTGAYSQIIYNDAEMKITEEAHESGGVLAGQTVKHLNGTGQVIKEESLGGGGVYDIVEAKYTNLGQPWKQTHPYRNGETPRWSETFYDVQGRPVKIKEPDDSETKAFYNEPASTKPSSAASAVGQTVRVVDAWGRERWGRYNAQDELAEVVEPNPSGNGTVAATGNMATSYQYDALGQLIETTQASQTRKFKYDSLGRLTRQKLAEQSATLNDSGQYVGATGTWSEAFWYDSRSNLTLKVDARGVKTHFSYQTGGADDPLNRLQSRFYDLSGPLDTSATIQSAPAVTYEYMTTGDKTRISRVRTAGILTEDYSYDGESRVRDYTQTVDSRTSYPLTTSYYYDTLNRIKEVHYPAQRGLAGNPRKVVEHSYDAASRLSTLKVGGQQQAGDIIYNAADQTTSIKIGTAGANQVTELYSYDSLTGLLTNQKVIRNGQNLLDLSYEYNRAGSNGTLNGKTGHLTKIVDNLNANKNREYEFDAVGRLTKAKGGNGGNLWTQTYSYDRYGNRTNVTATGVAADNSPIPVDGTSNLSYEATDNRINTSGYLYDKAGNQIKAKAADGVTWLRFEYDAANRLQNVKRDSDGATLQAFQYGSTNARLMDLDYSFGYLKIFASIGGQTLSEYTEFYGNTPSWTKSYNYLGESVLSTVTPNGQGGESTEFNHPDRLGTRIITNQAAGTSYEQTTLPFGTALNAESTITTNSRRFTSYERSNPTGLDYAINRSFDSKQGRFTQVDPIDMEAVDLTDPQSLNLYAYCGNDPINYTDPDGLFFSKLFKAIGSFFKKLFTNKWFFLAVSVALTVITIGAGLGLWSLTSVVVKSVSIMGYTGVAITLPVATTQISVLGWITLGLAAVAAAPALTSFRGIIQSVVSFGLGNVLGGISVPRGIGGTPDWNSNSSGFIFQQRVVRRGRRSSRRSGPGSWAWGFRYVRPSRKPGLNFSGLNGNRPLSELTHNEIYNAFRGNIFMPTNHAITQLARNPRTSALGIRTLNDYANSLNSGLRNRNYTWQVNGTLKIKHGRFATIVNPTTRMIITVKPD